jgi:hypothetical protein
LRIRYDELALGNLMRDEQIGMFYRLYEEGTGVVLGYVRREETAREISQSSGVSNNGQ